MSTVETFELLQPMIIVLSGLYASLLFFIVFMWPVKGEVIKRPEYWFAYFAQDVVGSYLIIYLHNLWLSIPLFIALVLLTCHMLRVCYKWKQLNFWRALLSVYNFFIPVVYILYSLITGTSIYDLVSVQ